MNKKFTFMVAALLAAGSVFAGDYDGAAVKDAPKAYYYLELGSSTFIKSEYSESTGGISFGAADSDYKNKDEFLWEVVVSGNDTKKVTLKNKATGYYLAFNDDADAFVSNAIEYTNGSKLIKDFNLTNGELTFGYKLGAATTETIAEVEYSSNKIIISTNASGSNNTIKLTKVSNEYVTVDELVKLGENFTLAFEGEPTGYKDFEGITVVEVPAGSRIETITNTNQFYLVKGKPAMKEGEFDLANSTVVVLSATSGITGVEAPNGYKYTTVKGERLLTEAKIVEAERKVESGKYPLWNAFFVAEKNASKDGKIVLAQPAVYTATDNKWDTQPTPAATPDVWVSATGNTGAALVNAQEEKDNAAWLTPSLGTVVDVKTLVKGKLVVNILASENKDNTVMKKVVFSSQEATSAAVLSTSTDETNEHKDAIYAQWVVSADKDANTVTFENRETGVSIDNVTLFKTPKANVYTASYTGDLFDDCFIELRTVENTTQWDGYLNLDKDALDSEYTLSVDAEDKFADIELPVIATTYTSDNSYAVLAPAENKDEKDVFTFKLAQSKDADTEKLDTVFVNVVKYGFYKDGKFTTANDTLKAISYSFTGLKNAGKKLETGKTDKDNDKVLSSFYLNSDKSGYDNETNGKFIVRKSGDKYQIKIADQEVYKNFVYNHSKNQTGSRFTTGSNTDGVKNAQLFSLNPVAAAPVYEFPESHVALEINGAYLGSKADGNAIMTNDTTMLKSTNVDAAFSFYAFSADKEATKTPSYYLSSNGKMMYEPKAEVEAIVKELNDLSPVFDAEKIAELKDKKATYYKDGNDEKDMLVKFQQAKYVDAENIALAEDTVKGDALKAYKFTAYDVDGQAVLKNANGLYITVLNEAVVLQDNIDNAAKFNVVAAEAPTSNEGVSATEVKVVANNGSIVVKNAAGKNVVVSTILGQVVANEVLTSDNATINVPAGIVVVAVEGESFKVNVK